MYKLNYYICSYCETLQIKADISDYLCVCCSCPFYLTYIYSVLQLLQCHNCGIKDLYIEKHICYHCASSNMELCNV